MKPRHFVFLLLGLLFVSCAAFQSKTDGLEREIFGLNEGIRWNIKGEVDSRVAPESREHISTMHAGFGKEILITGYEILHSRLSDDDSKADVTIKFIWYKQSELIVHESIFVQHWEHIERDWLLVSEELVSGEPF